jgi:hypothetical protein
MTGLPVSIGIALSSSKRILQHYRLCQSGPILPIAIGQPDLTPLIFRKPERDVDPSIVRDVSPASRQYRLVCLQMAPSRREARGSESRIAGAMKHIADDVFGFHRLPSLQITQH